MSVNVTWLQYATYAAVDYAPGDESTMASEDFGRYYRAHYVVLTAPAPPVPPTPTVLIRWLQYLTYLGHDYAPGDTATIATTDYVRFRAAFLCVLNSEPDPPVPYPDPFPQYLREADLADPTSAVGRLLSATIGDQLQADGSPANAAVVQIVTDELADLDPAAFDAAVADAAAGLDLITATDARVPKVLGDQLATPDPYLETWDDLLGRIQLGIRTDGGVDVGVLASFVATIQKLNGWDQIQGLAEISGYLDTMTDTQNRIALGLRTDGKVYVPQLLVDTIATPSGATFGRPTPEPSASTKKAVWAPSSALYNFHERNTMNWRAAWSRAMAGLGVAHVSAGIDSITFGQTTQPWVTSWPKRLYRLLATACGADAGTGFTPLFDLIMSNNSLDTRWTKGGTWTPYTTLKDGYGLPTGQGFGVMGRSCALISPAGWWQFAPAQSVVKLTAYFVVNTDSAGTATLAVDGSNVGTVNLITGAVTGTGVTLRAGSPSNVLIVDVAVTAGVHNLRVTVDSSSLGYLIGMEGSNPVGVKVTNLGRNGAAMSDWNLDDPTSHRYGLPWETDIPKADLQILMPIMNDRFTAIATLKENVRTACQRQRANGGDFMIMCPAQPNYAAGGIGGDSASYLALVTAMYELADEEDVPVVDLAWAWKDYATATALGYLIDNLHPGQLGCENIADRLTRTLAVK